MATAFWIADRPRYIEEARRSATTVKRHMPDVRTILFSPEYQEQGEEFDQTRKLPPRTHKFWFLDACRFFDLAVTGLSDEEHLLYFDTDTWMAQSIYDVFDILTRFDMCGTHAPGRVTGGTILDIPPAFPEFNIGVLGMRRTHKLVWVMDDWYRRYSEQPQAYRNNDQGALREALWESKLRLWVLPDEYNCRWGFGGYARYPVKVLHGRPKDGDYARVARQLNSSTDLRGWRRGDVE